MLSGIIAALLAAGVEPWEAGKKAAEAYGGRPIAEVLEGCLGGACAEAKNGRMQSIAKTCPLPGCEKKKDALHPALHRVLFRTNP